MRKADPVFRQLQSYAKSARIENHAGESLEIASLDQREAQLVAARKIMLAEFAGLDQQIGQIFSALTPWFIVPKGQRRPLTINLWGMTGVGKTSFVLKLVETLKLQSQFVNEDLGSWARKGRYNGLFAIDFLRLSGRPCVMLFDEMHTARSIDENGKSIPAENLQQIWSLFDSGKIVKSVDSMNRTLEVVKTERRLLLENPDNAKAGGYPGPIFEEYFLESLIFNLELYASSDELRGLIRQDRMAFLDWAIAEHTWHLNHSMYLDFRQALVFTAGNLDEVFTSSALVNPDDTNASDLHQSTKKIGSDRIKSHLLRRFRPEQVARLGNQHIVFPSLSRESFYKVIKNELAEIGRWTLGHSGIQITFDRSVDELLFKEGVLPVQGARSVLSAIKEIIESRLTHWLLLGLRQKVSSLEIQFAVPTSEFIVINSDKQKVIQRDPFVNRRQLLPKIDMSDSLRHTLAVHEAGHAVVGIVTQGRLPIKILAGPLAWHRGGPRVVFADCDFINFELAHHLLELYLAGNVAEKLVFGENRVSMGCSEDLNRATELAGAMIRRSGMGDHLAVSDKNFCNVAANSFARDDDALVERWLQAAHQRASEVLRSQWALFEVISRELINSERLTVVDLKQLVSQYYRGNRREIDEIVKRRHPIGLENYPEKKPTKSKAS